MMIEHYKEDDSFYWCVYFGIAADRGVAFDAAEIRQWCYDMFGPGLGEHRIDESPFIHRWVDDVEWGEIKFSREEDLGLFLLRWGT